MKKIEVTQKEFYNKIGKINTSLRVLSNYDVEFKDKNNSLKLVGISTDKENKYFLIK